MAAVPGRSELGEALRSCRNAFIGVGIMSCMINILYLTGSVFMLEVYDRVIPSRSVPTLVGLVILCGGLYVAQGILDMLRSRILGRIGTSLDEALNARVFETIVRLPLDGRQPQRWPAAAARSQLRPLLPRQHGAGRVLRPAVVAVLSGDLLCLPLADRRHRFGRRHHPGDFDADHRIHVAPAGPRDADAGGAPQRYRCHEPAQRRGAGCNGHVGTPDPALERGQRKIPVRQSARERRHRRSRRHRQGDAHDVAVGRARGRRLPCDLSGSHRRHHHRRLDPERAGTGSSRSRDRALEGFCRRAAELGAPDPPVRNHSGTDDANLAAEPIQTSVGRGRQHRAAGRPARRSCRTSISCSRPATASA